MIFLRQKILRIVLLCAAILFTGCGTDTGNPGEKPVSGINDPQNFGMNLGYRLCERIASCHGVAQTTCESAIGSASGITVELSLDPQRYPDLSAAMNGVLNNELQVNTAKFSNCQNAISALSCSDELVTGSYDSGSPNIFNHAYRLLRSSSDCAGAIERSLQ